MQLQVRARHLRRELRRQWGGRLVRIYFDNVSPHGRQYVQKLVLLGLSDLEVVQDGDNVLHEGFEFAGINVEIKIGLPNFAG